MAGPHGGRHRRARSLAVLVGAGAATAAVVLGALLAAGAGEPDACAACTAAGGGAEREGVIWGMALLACAPAILLAVVGGGLAHTRRSAVRREVERLLSELPPAGRIRRREEEV